MRQPPQRLKEDVFLLGGNASGRLIEDQRFHAQSQQADDFQLLALGDEQIVDRLMSVQLEAEARGQALQVGFGLRALEGDSFRAAVDEVLQHRESADIKRILLQHADAVGDGGGGPRVVDDAAVNLDFAFVGGLEAGQDFHERGLAGAIFAQDAHDSSVVETDVNVVIGVYGSKALVDVTQFDVHTLRCRLSLNATVNCSADSQFDQFGPTRHPSPAARLPGR